MNTLLLFRIEFIRSIWELKRNPFQTVTGLIVLGVIFYLILGAGRLLSSNAPTTASTASLILNYTLGMIVFSQVSLPSSLIRTESKNGMLEHLFLSGHSLATIFTARALGGLFLNILQMGVLLGGLLLLTGTTLEWSWYMVIPMLIAMISALGFGFWFGSVAMLIKDNSGVLVLSQLFLFGLVALPLIKDLWFYLIPIASATSLVNWAAFGGKPDFEYLLPALMSALGYFISGTFLLQKSLQIAKQKGILGHE